MSLFIKFIFSMYILILMSCGDVNKKKVSNEKNEQTKLLIQFLKTHKADYKIIYFEDLIENTEKVLLE